MRGKVVGGRTGGGGDQDAVAGQLLQAFLAVDLDPEVGGLVGLAQQ